ncbi:peroxidase-like [Physella acuta]|uniref:peroxidase-like n=1 Tax=Physella acuta TaxID=109671 RepID=UPI0027DB6D57|nr:peroxidase-like [Physella acuta]
MAELRLFIWLLVFAHVFSAVHSNDAMTMSMVENRRQRQSWFVLASTHAGMATGSFRGRPYALLRKKAEWCFNCTSYRYRSIDGSCNNFRNLGASFTAVPTWLPPAYSDGEDSPRQFGKDGLPLPSARNVSNVAHPSIIKLTNYTLMVMQWGQYIIHDLSAIPIATVMQWGQYIIHDLSAIPIATEIDSAIKCCGPNGGYPPFITNRNCFPIEIPEDEQHFSGKCLEFVRSIQATKEYGAKLRPRQQINVITSFMDASMVYGSIYNQSMALREGGYLMKTTGGNFLPQSPVQNCIKKPNSSDFCQLAGDTRVNEQPGLGVLHTLFIREHNRIAKILRTLRPKDKDESIFQLTRKIIIAMHQLINYNEYLPIILGKEAVSRMGLLSREGRTFYNPSINPAVANEFSTAAFRFGHSTIPQSLCIGEKIKRLKDLLHSPTECLVHYDELLADLCGVVDESVRQPLKQSDRNFVEDVTKFMFQPKRGPGEGTDLVSLNIQRGRDHGLAPYSQYRAFCGLRPPSNFSDVQVLGPNSMDLAKVYRSVHDIDLFTGLLYEPIETGDDASVGPTLKCLIGIQFFNTKFGDRFFFDTYNQNLGFNDAQLKSLRKMRLANVICSNSKLTNLTADVFSLPSETNPEIPCNQIKEQNLDLTLFA